MSSRARRPRAPAASPPQPRKRRRTKKSSVSSSYAALPVQGERVYVRKRPRNNIDSKPPSSSQSQEEQDDPILSQPFTTTKKNRQQRRINLGRGRKTKPRSKRQISWPSDPEPTPQDSHPKGFLAEHKPPTALTLSDDIEEIEDTSPDTVRKITPANFNPNHNLNLTQVHHRHLFRGKPLPNSRVLLKKHRKHLRRNTIYCEIIRRMRNPRRHLAAYAYLPMLQFQIIPLV